MKKMSEIMEELGFRPEASDEVKKAFIKNLIKEAQKQEFTRARSQKKREEGDVVETAEQISLFDQKISG